MKRFNKVFTVILSVGVAATNLVGAERWVFPPGLEPLAFPIEVDTVFLQAFARPDFFPSIRDYQERDFAKVDDEFKQAKAAEKDVEPVVKRARRTSKAAKQSTAFVPRQVNQFTDARRKVQARRAAAMIYRDACQAQSSMKSVVKIMSHPDILEDPSRGPRKAFVKARKGVNKAIESAQALVAMLNEQSGMMTPGTRDEFGKLVDLPADYAGEVERFIALLTRYADAIAAEIVIMEQEAQVGRDADHAEPVSSGMRLVVEKPAAPGIFAYASAASISKAPSQVPTLATDRRVGDEINAQALRVGHEITGNGWLMEAMRRVVPGAMLASLVMFGVIVVPSVALFPGVYELPALLSAGVVGGGLNLVATRPSLSTVSPTGDNLV